MNVATLFSAPLRLVGLSGGTAVSRCPMCGSSLEDPRVNPVTRALSRSCGRCREWYPLDVAHAPQRAE